MAASMDEAVKAYEDTMFARMEEVVTELAVTQEMMFHEDAPTPLITAIGSGNEETKAA